MVWLVVRSIPHGGPLIYFLSQHGVSKVWYVLSCLCECTILSVGRSLKKNPFSSRFHLLLIGPLGGIAPNQVIARSEFEVHHQIYTEWMWWRLWLVHICDSGDLCRYFDIYPMFSVAFLVWIITQWHLPLVDIWGGCKYCNWYFVWIWRLLL